MMMGRRRRVQARNLIQVEYNAAYIHFTSLPHFLPWSVPALVAAALPLPCLHLPCLRQPLLLDVVVYGILVLPDIWMLQQTKTDQICLQLLIRSSKPFSISPTLLFFLIQLCILDISYTWRQYIEDIQISISECSFRVWIYDYWHNLRDHEKISLVYWIMLVKLLSKQVMKSSN